MPFIIYRSDYRDEYLDLDTKCLLRQEADLRNKRGFSLPQSGSEPRCQLLHANTFVTLPVGVRYVLPMPWPA